MFDFSNSIVEGLFGSLAGKGGVIHGFIAEDGIVKEETQKDRVGFFQIFLGEADSPFVGSFGLLLSLF